MTLRERNPDAFYAALLAGGMMLAFWAGASVGHEAARREPCMHHLRWECDAQAVELVIDEQGWEARRAEE